MEEVPPLPELPPSLQGISPGYRWEHGVGSVGLDERRDQRGDGRQEKLQRGASGGEGQGGAALGEWQ